MINVIGLGYIGLPTALMMASHGVEVIGTDYNKELVATLNAGKTTFKEKGLDELFQNALDAGIKFTTEYQVTDTYIVSVPTPYDKFSKKVDACYVVAAVKDVMKVCPKGATIVIEFGISKSTFGKTSHGQRVDCGSLFSAFSCLCGGACGCYWASGSRSTWCMLSVWHGSGKSCFGNWNYTGDSDHGISEPYDQ